MKVFGVLAFVASGVLLSSGVARADNAYYLQRVQEELPYVYQQYSSQQLINEGLRICKYSSQGLEAADIANRIQAEMPMSEGAALEIQALAEMDLGC